MGIAEQIQRIQHKALNHAVLIPQVQPSDPCVGTIYKVLPTELRLIESESCTATGGRAIRNADAVVDCNIRVKSKSKNVCNVNEALACVCIECWQGKGRLKM
jgi:hypothetical protein